MGVLHLECAVCGRGHGGQALPWQCTSCGGALRYAGSTRFVPSCDPTRGHGLWRYAEALPPVSLSNRVTLGEGQTPIMTARWHECQVLFKLDYAMPTGSFKDRGTAVLISCLKELGIRSITEDSSGNAGASVAAYCARAGIHGRIFIPAGTSLGKRAQIRSYGVELTEVTGTRDDVAEAAIAAAVDGTFYASHVWSPFFLEGTKTFAFELWEQLGRAAPDCIVIPVGAGTLLLGAYLGFSQLLEAGLIQTMPRLYAIQSEGNSPLYRAYANGLADLDPLQPDPQPTIAEGIKVVRPARAREILRAVAHTGGAVEVVSDGEIRQAWSHLAELGLLVEPTAAVGAAALKQLLTTGAITPSERVVIPLTGSGLKSLDRIELMAARAEQPTGGRGEGGV